MKSAYKEYIVFNYVPVPRITIIIVIIIIITVKSSGVAVVCSVIRVVLYSTYLAIVVLCSTGHGSTVDHWVE